MVNLMDISMINDCLTLLGFLGALMLAIGNLVLLPPPVQPLAQEPCRSKRTPVYTRGDLWG